jgi:N-acetylmuramoyl-L-alanine amidase
MKIGHALTILAVILFTANFSGAAEILNVRYWAAPDHTRVVIELDGEPVYDIQDIQEGEKLLVLNFKEASSRRSLPAEITINKPGIKKVILRSGADGAIKAELILDKYLKTQVFKLAKFQDKPDRVVVDVFVEQVLREEMVKDVFSRITQKRIIVIDPGHGGDDPGAVGKKGTYEKNIVLLIGREIKKAVNMIPGYRAVLTRDGDYYVSFDKRMRTAKNLNASLFISVHADAARNRNAKGSSVYCLSTGAATSEAAKLLAKNENLSDIIGGVPNGEGKPDSDQILLNMFQTNTINLSRIYAGTLMNQLDKVNCLKYKNVQEAPFKVLKLPDIPAVLIETAYISNGEEERLLMSGNFQKKLALAVASSVKEYLSGTASIAQGSDAVEMTDTAVNPGEVKPALKVNGLTEAVTDYYKIKPGDTLFSIARLFNTKVTVILKLNNRKMEDPLYAGLKILVPVNKNAQKINGNGDVTGKTDRPDDAGSASRVYTVRKGDTLFSLAKKNSLTVDELRNLNNMKSSDPLLSGRKIKLP